MAKLKPELCVMAISGFFTIFHIFFVKLRPNLRKLDKNLRKKSVNCRNSWNQPIRYNSGYKLIPFFLFFLTHLYGDVIVVSDRAQFLNPEKISGKQHKFRPPFRSEPVDHTKWVDQLSDKKVVILIHGYNTDYEHALEFFSTAYNGVEEHYDQAVCYLWPGYDDFWEYLHAKKMVMKTNLAQRLNQLISEISAHTKQTDVFAFSTGCRLILEALKQTPAPSLTNLFLVAPAVDNEALEKGERYFSSIDKTEKTFVFYSKKDGVLNWGYPLYEWDVALGAKGAENPLKVHPKVYLVNSSEYVKKHHDAFSTPYIFNIITNVHKFDQELTENLALHQLQE